MVLHTAAMLTDMATATASAGVHALHLDMPSCKHRLDVTAFNRPPSRTLMPAHTGIYKLHLEAQQTLDSCEACDAVKLPLGINKTDWIASKMVAVFERVECLVNAIREICTDDTCPRMSAGKCVVYSWVDEVNPTPQLLSAPAYMSRLLDSGYPFGP